MIACLRRSTPPHLVEDVDDGDSIVTAPEVERNTKTDVVTCEGPVKYWSAKANLVCDHMVIYRKEKRAVLTGSVVMYVKPEDKQELDEKMRFS